MHFCLSGPCSQPQIFSESTPKPTPIGLLGFCIFLQICFKCSLALSQELKQKSSIHKYGILWLLFASEDASAAHQHEHTTSYLGTGRGLNFTPFWGVRDLVHSLNVLWRTTRPYQSFRTYRYASKPIEWNMHLESHLKKKVYFTTGHKTSHNRILDYLPASLFPAQLQACRDTECKTCHFAPSSSSFGRAPQSSPTSTCQDGNQWEDPTNLALVVTHIQFETTLLSRILMHSADAGYKHVYIKH